MKRKIKLLILTMAVMLFCSCVSVYKPPQFASIQEYDKFLLEEQEKYLQLKESKKEKEKEKVSGISNAKSMDAYANLAFHGGYLTFVGATFIPSVSALVGSFTPVEIAASILINLVQFGGQLADGTLSKDKGRLKGDMDFGRYIEVIRKENDVYVKNILTDLEYEHEVNSRCKLSYHITFPLGVSYRDKTYVSYSCKSIEIEQKFNDKDKENGAVCTEEDARKHFMDTVDRIVAKYLTYPQPRDVTPADDVASVTDNKEVTEEEEDMTYGKTDELGDDADSR